MDLVGTAVLLVLVLAQWLTELDALLCHVGHNVTVTSLKECSSRRQDACMTTDISGKIHRRCSNKAECKAAMIDEEETEDKQGQVLVCAGESKVLRTCCCFVDGCNVNQYLEKKRFFWQSCATSNRLSIWCAAVAVIVSLKL